MEEARQDFVFVPFQDTVNVTSLENQSDNERNIETAEDIATTRGKLAEVYRDVGVCDCLNACRAVADEVFQKQGGFFSVALIPTPTFIQIKPKVVSSDFERLAEL